MLVCDGLALIDARQSAVPLSAAWSTVGYSSSVPAKGSAVALTVTPNVAVYRYHFSDATSYEAVDLLMQEVENSNVSWSSSTFVYIDRQTAEVTVSNGGSQKCFFYVKFSSAATGHGTFTSSGTTDGATSISGRAARADESFTGGLRESGFH